MNNKLQALALAGSALLAVSLGATQAQAAPATASAQAKAKILRQLTITKNTDLNFGTIIADQTAGSVAIATDGSSTCTGVVCTGGTTAASFKVTGNNNEVVSVTVPASVSLTGPTGSTAMTASLAAPKTLNLGNSGSSGTALNFGGTLSVAANQVGGEYTSANFDVTVDYQ